MISNLDKLHYGFCGELTNNISLICPDSQKRSSFSVSFPKLSLFKVDTNFASNFLSSFRANNYVELENIKFIDDLVIKEVERESFSDIMQGSYIAFIAPHDFLTATNKKENTRNYYLDQIQGTITFAENEGQKWFYEQPHLISHTTFQLFFMDGMLGTYNLGKMDYKVEEGKVIVNYVLVVKATPSGILFKFQSGEVSPPIRWNLAVKGSVVTMRVFQAIYQGQKSLWQKIKNPLLKIGGGIAGAYLGGPAGAAAGSAAGSAMAGGDNKEKSPVGVELNRGIGEAIGFSSVKGGKASEEQHTNRLVEQVGRTSESISDPTLYYTNNIDYHFNFFDFWMRLCEWDRIMSARLVFSSTLFNNLLHNNDQNPNTYPLNITFTKLAKILRKGYWRGELKLAYDPRGFLTNKFKEGIRFFEDMSKDFPDPDLRASQQQSTSLYSLGGFGDVYIGEEIREGGEPTTVPSNRPKGSNYHQRGHYFIFYEDGTQEHWMALYPMFQDSELAKGHSHGAFTLEFNKPVARMVDIYSCIGCGATTNNLFVSLHSGYHGGNDSWDTIHRGLPFEPWFTEMGRAVSPEYNLTVNGVAGRLGSQGDVWEKATQQRSDGKSFVKAYGYVPSGDTITWDLTDEGNSRIKYQKQPTNDDFTTIDYIPPPGSGGEIEIPLEDPEIAIPEPGEGNFFPEDDFTPDPFDPTRGEPEIPPIEPDLPADIDPGLDPDDGQDIDPPPIEPEVPEPDPNDPDAGQDPDQTPDTGDHDPPPDFPDDDPDGD
jgi:hypothetical protein